MLTPVPIFSGLAVLCTSVVASSSPFLSRDTLATCAMFGKFNKQANPGHVLECVYVSSPFRCPLVEIK